jgi:hypothetical protein
MVTQGFLGLTTFGQVLSIGDNREFQIISGEDENGQLQVGIDSLILAKKWQYDVDHYCCSAALDPPYRVRSCLGACSTDSGIRYDNLS